MSPNQCDGAVAGIVLGRFEITAGCVVNAGCVVVAGCVVSGRSAMAGAVEVAAGRVAMILIGRRRWSRSANWAAARPE